MGWVWADLERWEPFLAVHLNQNYAAFLHQGLKFGLSIVIVNYYNVPSRRGGKGQTEGGLTDTDSIHTSLIPKSHQPGRFCLIVDWSSPVSMSMMALTQSYAH